MKRWTVTLRIGFPCLFLVGFGVAQPAGAQTIVGRVVEDGKRTAITGAAIALLHGGREERAHAVTDSAGFFRVAVSGPGDYRLRVHHVAFSALETEPVKVGPAETVRVEIRLAEARIPLEPLIVTVRTTNPRLVEFHDRRLASATGRFITRVDIERSPISRTTDLLRGVAGVEVIGMQVRGGSRTRFIVRMRASGTTCEPAIYIDGLSVRQLPESTIDDLLVPSNIDGVEIYTTTANAPVRYASQSNCGVVLFWTGVGQSSGKKSSLKQVLIGGGVALAILGLIASGW
jgi:hypothetical protein